MAFEWYSDIGHKGKAQLWYLKDDDLLLGEIGEGSKMEHDKGKYGHLALKCRAEGRIDHDQRAISLCGDEEDEDILYAKKLLAMDFPGYRQIVFW